MIIASENQNQSNWNTIDNRRVPANKIKQSIRWRVILCQSMEVRRRRPCFSHLSLWLSQIKRISRRLRTISTLNNTASRGRAILKLATSEPTSTKKMKAMIKLIVMMRYLKLLSARFAQPTFRIVLTFSLLRWWVCQATVSVEAFSINCKLRPTTAILTSKRNLNLAAKRSVSK